LNKKKFVYVFLTDLTSDNITDEQIENFIINAVDMHKGFENDLKLKPKKKIDFSKLPTTEEEEAKAKAKAKTEKKKSKSKVKAEATESRDIIEQLKELKKLYDDGILTKEQFEKAKDVLLSKNN
jgi:type I site-specific restriction endonuclease